MSSKNHWCYQCWNREANRWQPELFVRHNHEQAVSDAKEKFLEVSIGWPGVMRDAKVFATLHIDKAMQEGWIPKLCRALLSGRVNVSFLLWVDLAYLILYYCIKYWTCCNNGQAMLNITLQFKYSQPDWVCFWVIKSQVANCDKMLEYQS